MKSKAAKLRKSAQLINSDLVLSDIPHFAYWQNREGKIVGCSKKFLSLLGVKNNKKVIGKTSHDLSQDFKWLAEMFDHLSICDKKVLEKGRSRQHKLWVFPKKTSKTKILLACTHNPLYKKETLLGVFVELVDITGFERTERRLEGSIKKAKKEVKITALQLDRILAHLPSNVYWVDKNSANLGCNDNLAKMLGFNSREEVKGLTYYEMAKIRKWPAQQAKLWRTNDLEVMKTGKPNENINFLTDSKGELIYQTTARVPFRDEHGKIIGVIGISTDITDRVKKEKELVEAREKAEIANQAKSDFLATVSHELRTPLNGIIGMTDLLTRQKVTDEQRVFLEDIANSGKALLALINGILDLSKLEAGELEIINTPFELKTIVDNVVKQVSPQALQKKIILSTEFEKDVPTRLLGDSQRLNQILLNIVGNAVKFTDAGTVSVKVKCLQKSNRKHTLSFIISDTGVGIPKDQINVIFDRFRQLDSTYSKVHSGTGLGLAIVKELVELMNGEVFVDSKMKKGTTFTVNLTFTAQPELSKTNAWVEKYSNIRILVVDDDLVIGTKVLKLIHTPAVSLVSSSSAFETLENAAKRNQQYQIILYSRQSHLEEKSNIKKLKRLLPSLYFPMIISYGDGPKDSPQHEGVVFGSISRLSFDNDFLEQLSSLWKKYKVNLSNVTAAFADLNPKILLVEDNLINQKVTLHLLKELGCEADVADNGLFAIKLFKKNDYDIILMDIGLPDMDGCALTKKIRAIESKGEHVPIIALTAYASEDDRKNCLDAGMDSVLTKPINGAGLLHMLSEWLLGSRVSS